MNKIVSLIITTGLIIGLVITVVGKSSEEDSVSGGGEVEQNIEVKNGVQYITITAKGGYYPQITNAKAGMLSKILVKTNGTYDCSASLVIRSIGYQKILAQSGEEEIELGVREAGTSVQGTCGMGMYNFVINFS